MNYIKLSIEELRKVSRELANEISKSYKPDLVIFVAKGAFLIGHEISNYFKVPLLAVFAERGGGRIKNFLSPLLRLLPKKIKLLLRRIELKSNIHINNPKRNIYIVSEYNDFVNRRNILIIDDSVDSGNTAKEVCNFVCSKFPNSNIKFAALNYFDKSTHIFNVDYHFFKNTILMGPMSNDSEEYSQFLKLYNLWIRETN